MTNFIEISKIEIAVDYIPKEVCKRIKNAVQQIRSDGNDPEWSLWDHTAKNSDVQILKDKFLEVSRSLLNKNSNTVKNLPLDRAWYTNYKDNEYIGPHHHGNSFIVGIAYIDVDEDSGDLLIQDPLSSYNWINRKHRRQSGNCSANIPITPVTGMVVVMPGYLIHSSEPKYPGKSRFIISTNFSYIKEI